MKVFGLTCLLAALVLPSCSTVKDWSDVAKSYAKEKTLVIAEPTAAKVLQWNAATKTWEPKQATLKQGSYVLPSLPELLGLNPPGQ